MENGVIEIKLLDMLWCLIPCIIVIYTLFRWQLNGQKSLYAFARMLGQLLLIGYLLTYIFSTRQPWLVFAILFIMIIAASWIALGNSPHQRKGLLKEAIIAVAIGGGVSLSTAVFMVLDLEPWYLPHYVIPLAGMVFAASMNSVSLAVERFFSDISQNKTIAEAKRSALNAATIPVINSLFAVGLVTLPGMMTGQILSGVSPLIAARYQIMVMCIIFSAAGLSAIIFLLLTEKKQYKLQDEPITSET